MLTLRQANNSHDNRGAGSNDTTILTMGLISILFPRWAAERRRQQDQNQQQQSQSQSQSQQLILQPTTRYQQQQPPYNNAVTYANTSNNNYPSLASFNSRPSKKPKIVVPVIDNKIVVPVLSLPTKIIIPNEALLSQQHHHQQLLPLNSITNESNYYNDDVSFTGNGDELDIESQGVLTANDINLEDYIEVVQAGRNGVTWCLKVALSEGEEWFIPKWYLRGRDQNGLAAIRINKELWRTKIIRYLDGESISNEADHWAEQPQGKAKHRALKTLLEAVKSQMINNETISANIKAYILQSQSNDDDGCPIDSEIAQYLAVVQSDRTRVSLNIATDIGELGTKKMNLYFKKAKGWILAINVPLKYASDLWNILQPLLSAVTSEILKEIGIDIDREDGLSTHEKTAALQRIQYRILTSKVMSRAVKDVVDNTADQATPTTNDIFFRPPHHLKGEDLARTQNEDTVF